MDKLGMTSPYQSLPDTAFWKSAVASKNPLQISDLWRCKINLSKTDRIATAGSCFAQHIGRALARAGYDWFDAEPGPTIFDSSVLRSYNYGIFSFRTGNIYTAALLNQWMSWAFGEAEPSKEVWRKAGRFVDPFRPVIEPGGFESEEEMRTSRSVTLEAIRRSVEKSQLFVFTMGLTECWSNVDGSIYPMCPGTSAGEFDPAKHRFTNCGYERCKADMLAAIKIMRKVNPGIQILLTVSPVPLTAAASGEHVLTATTYSKSTLRAVAGDLAQECEGVDYFPSYEIITGFPFKGFFFEPNQRDVAPEGVAFVMQSFFNGMGAHPVAAPSLKREAERVLKTPLTEDDLVCEEAILEAQ